MLCDSLCGLGEMVMTMWRLTAVVQQYSIGIQIKLSGYVLDVMSQQMLKCRTTIVSELISTLLIYK